MFGKSIIFPWEIHAMFGLLFGMLEVSHWGHWAISLHFINPNQHTTKSWSGCFKKYSFSHFTFFGVFCRYEMSNCLFEAAYEEILHRCNCTPSFHQTGIKEYPRICTGTKLRCMTRILHRIGKFNVVSCHYFCADFSSFNQQLL
jgi:hypothetical protein